MKTVDLAIVTHTIAGQELNEQTGYLLRRDIRLKVETASLYSLREMAIIIAMDEELWNGI